MRCTNLDENNPESLVQCQVAFKLQCIAIATYFTRYC